MGDNRTDLPEGTDLIIDGALETDETVHDGDRLGDRHERPPRTAAMATSASASATAEKS